MVRKRTDGQVYAMKVINKKHIMDEEKVEQIINERKILTTACIDHPYMVQLHYAFTSVRY